jgi:SAM-dependent methyltransferase
MPACPLCRSVANRVVHTVEAAELAGLYERAYGLDVRRLFDAPTLALRLCGECDLRFFEFARPGDQAFYSGLNSNAWYYTEEKPEFEFARGLIGERDTVLEVGAGAGRFGKGLAPERYTGLDFSESASRYAQAAGVRVLNEPVESHAKAHPARYDIVCHFQVLEHVQDPRSFLEACVACLKPGGRLIVAVPAQDSFLGVATNNQLNLPPHHLTAWSDAALRSIGRLMSVELLQIVHEPVSGVHRRGFLDTWFAFVLNRLAGREPRPVDVGLAQRMVARTARAIGDRIGDLIPDYLLGRGHTVSAVFRRD